MTCNHNWLHNYQSLPVNHVMLGNNTMINAIGVSTIWGTTIVNGCSTSLVLVGILLVLQLEKNLISPNWVTELGYVAIQDHRGCTIHHARCGTMLLVAQPNDSMLCVPLTLTLAHMLCSLATTVHTTTLNQLHRCLGHVSEQQLHSATKTHGYVLPHGNTLAQCVPCIKGKQAHLAIGKGPVAQAPAPMHTIHSDMCRLMPTTSHM
jgi:hypothetical protein